MLAADPSGVIFQPSVFRRESQKTSFSLTSFSQQVYLLEPITWNYFCLFLLFITHVGEVDMWKSEDNVKEYFSSMVGSRGWVQLIISPAQITLMPYWKNWARKPFLNQLAAQRWRCKLGFRVIMLSILEISWLPILATCCVDLTTTIWQKQCNDKCFMGAYGLREQPAMMGKLWWQELRAANYAASTVRRQKLTNFQHLEKGSRAGITAG